MMLSGTAGKGKAILVIDPKSDSEAELLEKVCKVLHCRYIHPTRKREELRCVDISCLVNYL